MPASHKMLKSRQQAANRAAGIGDEQGRLPSKVKAAEVMARCTICSQEIRMTKKNIEAVSHFTSRHPTSTFITCFPGQFDPTAVAVASAPAAAPAPAPSADISSAASIDNRVTAAITGSSAMEGDVNTVFTGALASAAVIPVVSVPKVAKKKPAQDLSFLDAALDSKVIPGKKK